MAKSSPTLLVLTTMAASALGLGCVDGGGPVVFEGQNAAQALLGAAEELAMSAPADWRSRSLVQDLAMTRGRLGMANEALAMALPEGMDTSDPNEQVQGYVVWGLVDGDRLDEALDLVATMEPGFEREANLGRIAGSYAMQRECDAAAHIMSLLDETGFREQVQYSVAYCYAQVENPDQAIAVAYGLASSEGPFHLAVDVLSVLLGKGFDPRELAGADPDHLDAALARQALHLHRDGECGEAERLARHIGSPDTRFASLVWAASCHLEAGNDELGRDLIGEAQALGGLSRDRCERAHRLAQIGNAFEQAELEAEARGAALSAYQVGCGRCDPRPRTLTRLLVRTGYVDLAVERAQSCTAEDELVGYTAVYALIDVAAELVQQGQIEQALSIADTIEVDSMRELAVVDVVGQLAREGRYDEALALADRLSSPDDPSQRDYGRSAIAQIVYENMLSQGQAEEAAALVEASSGWTRDYLLLQNATMELSAGRYGLAESIASSVEDPVERQFALQGLVYGLVNEGELGRAQALIDGRLDPQTRNGPVHDLARHHASEGRLGAALATVRSLENPIDVAQVLTRIAPEIEADRSLSEEEVASLLGIFETISFSYDESSAHGDGGLRRCSCGVGP